MTATNSFPARIGCDKRKRIVEKETFFIYYYNYGVGAQSPEESKCLTIT
jgi:hypothetical protein